MAYVSQDRKRTLAALAKPVLKKYGMKGTFGVRNGSTLVCNIKSGKLDLIGNSNALTKERADLRGDAAYFNTSYMDINSYNYTSYFSGECLKFVCELMEALNSGNHDRSDITTDYFDVGWYVDVNIGRWDKPYVLES